MSIDQRVTKDLIETLEDGKHGFARAADLLSDSDRPELAARCREFAEQRAGFSAELELLAASYGDDIDEGGSVAAKVHRGWMALKDAVTGSDAAAVLNAALSGEDHAVSEYEDALSKDISAGLRDVVQRQFTVVSSTRDAVAAMSASASDVGAR